MAKKTEVEGSAVPPVLAKSGKPIFVGISNENTATGYSADLKPLVAGLVDGTLKGIAIYINNVKVSL